MSSGSTWSADSVQLWQQLWAPSTTSSLAAWSSSSAGWSVVLFVPPLLLLLLGHHHHQGMSTSLRPCYIARLGSGKPALESRPKRHWTLTIQYNTKPRDCTHSQSTTENDLVPAHYQSKNCQLECTGYWTFFG